MRNIGRRTAGILLALALALIGATSVFAASPTFDSGYPSYGTTGGPLTMTAQATFHPATMGNYFQVFLKTSGYGGSYAIDCVPPLYGTVDDKGIRTDIDGNPWFYCTYHSSTVIGAGTTVRMRVQLTGTSPTAYANGAQYILFDNLDHSATYGPNWGNIHN